MSELLPCPFCGTKAVSPVLDHNQGMKWGAVECDRCGAKGPEVRTDYTENGPWVEKAKEEWNRRHVTDDIAGFSSGGYIPTGDHGLAGEET